MSNTIYSETCESNTHISFEDLISYIESFSKKFNYTYIITEMSSNKKYIGVRSCDIPIEKDLGSIYKSSSSDLDFINRQKTNKKDYKYELLTNYESRFVAQLEEIRLHNLYKVDINPDYFNKVKATLNKFSAIGKTTVYDQEGNQLYVSVDDPKYISGEYISISKGTFTVRDKDGNKFRASLTDPKYLCGDYIHINTGMVQVIDEDGNKFQTLKDNPDYISGKLKCNNGTTTDNSAFTGKVMVRDENGNHTLVSKDDPLYLDGTLISMMKGKIAVRDKDGNCSSVYKDDPLYLSGDLIPVNKGMITAVDEFGVKHRISTSHPDYISGKLKSIYSGKGNAGHIGYTKAKDRYGNSYIVTKGDQRILSGELIGHSAFWYSINRIIYSAIEAEKEFGIKLATLKTRCKSDLLEWKDWSIIL